MQWWRPSLRFSIQTGPYLMPHLDPCRKNQFVSITFSSRDIWTKMYYLTIFKQFVSMFSFICGPNDPPLLLILDLFDPSFWQNLRSDWVQFVIVCWNPIPKIWWSTPPTGLQYYSKFNLLQLNCSCFSTAAIHSFISVGLYLILLHQYLEILWLQSVFSS